MNGGNGADTFVFSTPDRGSDLITGFVTTADNAVHDVLRFDAANGEVSTMAEFLAGANQVGAHIHYDLHGDGLNTIVIENTQLASLGASGFEFL